jgi:hypothetical protein
MPDTILWTGLILAPFLTFLLVGAWLVEKGWPRLSAWWWLRLRNLRWTWEDELREIRKRIRNRRWQRNKIRAYRRGRL